MDRFENFMEICVYNGFRPSEEFQTWLKENGFFMAPASTKYHGAYEGGLFDHSLKVCKRLISLTYDNKLVWQRKESPVIVGMFHDLCKVDQYVISGEENGKPQYAYNDKVLLKGHGIKSIALLSQFVTLTEEEIACIRYHMGAYETEEWAEFDRAIHKYPNVLWSHLADMIASKIDNV